jgi:AcrR family transcriptional regulator
MPRTKKKETKENILSAARHLFSKNGYHETNVSDIIKKIGMSHGSFYTYFKNKRDIFQLILEEFINKITGIIKKHPVDLIKNKSSYIVLVDKISKSVTAVFLNDISLTRIFFWDAIGIDAEFDRRIDETYIDVTSYCKAYLEKGQELGIIRKSIDTELVASATIGMCTHLINRYLRNDFGKISSDKIIETILDLQLNGIIIR